MSFERAAKNCIRCYSYSEIINAIKKDTIPLTDLNPVFVLYGNRDSATNEAMKALEDVIEKMDRINEDTVEKDKIAVVRALAQKCLSACLHCDYSKATIYGILLEENAVAATTNR